MEFGTVLRRLRKQRGLTQDALAKRLEISKSTISMYEQGERMPAHDLMCRIADLFDVEMDLLYGREEAALPSDLQPIRRKKFPMLGEIACGAPIFADEEKNLYVEATDSIRADFCLTAKGDSMIGARIRDGDVVFIRSQSTVENGQIAAVIIDEEATLKRWYYFPEEQKLVLTPENPAYAPLVYIGKELETVRCLGQAVAFLGHV